MGILNKLKGSGKKQKPKKNFVGQGKQSSKNPSFSEFPDFNTPPNAPMNNAKNLGANDLDLPPLPSFDDKEFPSFDTAQSQKAQPEAQQEPQFGALPHPTPPNVQNEEPLVQPKPVEPVEPIYHTSKRGNYTKPTKKTAEPAKRSPVQNKPLAEPKEPQQTERIEPIYEESSQKEQEPKQESFPHEAPALSNVPDFKRSGYLNKPTAYEKKVKKPVLRDIPQEPLFIQMKEFHDVLHEINTIQYRLKELNNVDNLFSDIQVPSDTQYGHWHETVEDIQRKLLYVDRMIFEQNDE